MAESGKNEKKPRQKNSPSDVHDAAQKLGRLGGVKGGPARAEALTAEEKSKIASMGGEAAKAKRRAAKATLKKRIVKKPKGGPKK